MEQINFSISINAPKETVWETLWNDASYRKWTSAFMEGSYAETDNWKEGTEVKFLSPDGGGLVSKIVANKPAEFMSFEHLGEVKNWVEDRDSEKVKEWAGAKENYILKETGGVTTLEVDMDIVDEYKDYFVKTFLKALEEVKALAENNN